MFVVQLTKDVSYRPLYPLTPYASPDSLIVTNNSPAQLFIVQADTQPLDDALNSRADDIQMDLDNKRECFCLRRVICN